MSTGSHSPFAESGSPLGSDSGWANSPARDPKGRGEVNLHTITLTTLPYRITYHDTEPYQPLILASIAIRVKVAKSSTLSDAPPTSAPSISGCIINSRILSGLTLPPYWMRTCSALSAPYSVLSTPRIARRMIVLACSPVALRPVPIAQIGS